MVRQSLRRAAIALLAVVALAAPLHAATGTPMPTPYQSVFDSNGNPVSGACVWSYIAGTSTPVATYTDVTLATPNTNPIVADSAGRFTAWLSAGSSYKFTYEAACTPPAHAAVMRTVDHVLAVPGSSVNLDITGAAGEALTAGQVVYLSDGSGGKTAGLWFKADSANTYSSSAAVSVGMVPASIGAGASGSIRLAGQVTGLTALTAGTTYYVGTAGALTSTPPANSRVVGIADSTTTLILGANPGIPAPPNADNGVNCFRLTLTTGVPVTTADVTAATTIYATPKGCNRIALYDSAGVATTVTSAQFSIAVPATTSTMYDLFAYSNAGVATLEALAWTNDTTRATAIVLTTTGSYTKSADLTRRYLGSFRTTAVSGQTEDSGAKRFLWNYYHRDERPLQRLGADGNYTYTSATIRQVNANTANRVELIVGVAEVTLRLQVTHFSANSSAGQSQQTGIGEDSTTAYVAGMVGGTGASSAANVYGPLAAAITKKPVVGYHAYNWLESVPPGTLVATWYTNGYQTSQICGMTGWVEG